MTVTVSNDIGTLIGIGIYLLIFLAGLRSFVLGFRGKKIDDHPLCAKCRFDLTGLPQDQESCPECGANLLRKGTVVGNRKRHHKRIVIGLVMMVTVIGLCVPTALRIAGQVNWLSHAPVWYLRSQINNDTSLAKESWSLLLQRYDSNSLTLAQKQALTKDAIQLQSDITRKWYVEAGDIIDHMHVIGQLSQEQWDQYRGNIIDHLFKLTVRKDIEKGKWIAVSFAKGQSRIGYQQLWCKRGELRFSIGDMHLHTRRMFDTKITQHSGGTTSFYLPIKSEVWEQIQTGKQTISAQMKCWIYEDALHPLPKEIEGLDVLERDLKFEQDVQILPKGTSTVSGIVDETIRDQMSNAITVKLRYKPEKYADWDVNLKFNMLPRPIAFDVSIRYQGQIQRMSSVHVPSNSQSEWGIGRRFRLDIKDGEKVDVLLTPSAEVAEKTTYLTEYWDGAITIKDVPVSVE